MLSYHPIEIVKQNGYGAVEAVMSVASGELKKNGSFKLTCHPVADESLHNLEAVVKSIPAPLEPSEIGKVLYTRH